MFTQSNDVSLSLQSTLSATPYRQVNKCLWLSLFTSGLTLNFLIERYRNVFAFWSCVLVRSGQDFIPSLTLGSIFFSKYLFVEQVAKSDAKLILRIVRKLTSFFVGVGINSFLIHSLISTSEFLKMWLPFFFVINLVMEIKSFKS